MMRRAYKRAYLLVIFLFSYAANAQSVAPVTLHRNDEVLRINEGIEYFEDPAHNIPLDSAVTSSSFKPLQQQTPNLGITKSAFWLRIKVRNESEVPRLILRLSNPAIDSIECFAPADDSSLHAVRTGESFPFKRREYLSSDFLFSVIIPLHQERYIYIHASSSEAVLLPLAIGTETRMMDSDKYKDIFWGIYIGVMLAMLLYNCFVYLTTKDRSYLYYIAYVLTVVIAQITISGYAFQLLWPNELWIARYSAFITPALVGMAGIGFMRNFLKTKEYVPKGDKVFIIFFLSYIAAVILTLASKFNVGQNMIDMTASSVSLYMLGLAIVISRKGYRPATFFLIAWIVFLIGVFVFVFKNFSILPYNNFTVYTMPVGSAMEVILLSFALADRINILKREKEETQQKVLLAVQENERIVREQNIILEKKVNERTHELKLSNDELNIAMVELKEAETQLVESEKMASLGQLTAGIAHEINNPINFVTSNVKPLNRDVRMLIEVVDRMEKLALENGPGPEKQKKIDEYKNDIDYDYLKIEIDQLLNGIGEGASRTAEIVKGLRIFSRLDEDDLKKADINEGLESTLVITNNLLNNMIKVEKKYANLPMVECYPGKLNQVFLNIISNGIYAIKKVWGEKEGGVLSISTDYDKTNVFIKIADNGTGMDEATRKRLFEPFFTTKEVGEGTGLGMSIAYNTINKHSGQIQVNTEPGKGTEFVLVLPIIHK